MLQVNCNQFEQSATIVGLVASATSWNYSEAEGYGWTMTPVVNSSDDMLTKLNNRSLSKFKESLSKRPEWVCYYGTNMLHCNQFDQSATTSSIIPSSRNYSVARTVWLVGQG